MALNNITVQETEGSKAITEGMHRVVTKAIQEATGEFGNYVKISFEIVDGEFRGVTKTMVASLKLFKSKTGKNSKLFDVVKAVLKTEPKPGDNLDLNQLIGKTCQILVVNGKVVNGIQYQNIERVLPD